MKTKVEKSYTYEGLGFPVHLTNVPMVKIRGEFTLDIDFNKLQKAVLLHLSYKKTPLTGNEIKFIRKYFSLTVTAFGHLFGYSHSAVLKWESQGNAIARIAPTTEIYLRLYIMNKLSSFIYFAKNRSNAKRSKNK
jgi:DNA-binding transcriptional regulator YiaG